MSVTLGLTIGVIMALIEIIKSLINFFVSRFSTNTIESNLDELITISYHNRSVIDKVFDMHNVRDPDGQLIWYNPRSAVVAQSEVMEDMKEMLGGLVNTQHNMIQTQDTMTKVLEKLVDIVNDIDKRTS